jgi:hypothetical protein
MPATLQSAERPVWLALLAFGVAASALNLVEYVPQTLFPGHFQPVRYCFYLTALAAVGAGVYSGRETFKNSELAPFYTVLLFGFVASTAILLFFTYANLPAPPGDPLWIASRMVLYLIAAGAWTGFLMFVFGRDLPRVVNRRQDENIGALALFLLYAALIILASTVAFAIFNYNRPLHLQYYATIFAPVLFALIVFRKVIPAQGASTVLIAAAFSILFGDFTQLIDEAAKAMLMSQDDWDRLWKRAPDHARIASLLYRFGVHFAASVAAYGTLRAVFTRPLYDVVRRA